MGYFWSPLVPDSVERNGEAEIRNSNQRGNPQQAQEVPGAAGIRIAGEEVIGGGKQRNQPLTLPCCG